MSHKSHSHGKDRIQKILGDPTLQKTIKNFVEGVHERPKISGDVELLGLGLEGQALGVEVHFIGEEEMGWGTELAWEKKIMKNGE
jgi:hypothetical protein